MLNEPLYECLVELGADGNKAKAAASENKRIAEILRYVTDIHIQQSEANYRLCVVEKDVAVLKQDVAVLKEDVAVLKEDVAVLKEDVKAIKSDAKATNIRLDSLETKMDFLIGLVKDLSQINK